MATKKAATLLDQARSVRTRSEPRHPVTEQEIEVAVAWLQDELNLTQVSHAFYPDAPTSAKTLYRIAVCLREARRLGQIEVAA